MTTTSIRLVQIMHPQLGRQVGLVQEPFLVLLQQVRSVYNLALEAINTKNKVAAIIQSRLSAETLDYDAVYQGLSDWRLLPAFDHPENPMNCIVSGTGLTHKNSALNRQMMHQAATDKPTDSMQMYLWGLAGGQPEAGTVGVQPEWFYKGIGAMLRGHSETLEVPSYANDGGEEPEIAGAYLVDSEGYPWRIGFCTGNEFSDHVMEKKNYLYLAPSKLRTCAIGPELVLDTNFQDISGSVRILRNKEIIWSKEIKTGEKNMAHSLQNLEHHHFKYAGHRVPGQAHVHFYGADAFSFGEKVQLQSGDIIAIEWAGLGRSLLNPIKVAAEKEELVQVKSIT
ncbi:hypothetical protein AAE02nite_20380 [Adhaeribacter aerolatus]|uniref:GguC protein n=1 Tax=Adhaeribacter aerolatus TaxID=670289 RepID=A0A512AXF2_9BACT|nr:AraD1 family protein [Adhaeribacter aerolatus]GEO04374.1 hypothetical protein AAE02nite_20380 [Adhaeribacter aerolatus]